MSKIYSFQSLKEYDGVVYEGTHKITPSGAPIPKTSTIPTAEDHPSPQEHTTAVEPPPTLMSKNERLNWARQAVMGGWSTSKPTHPGKGDPPTTSGVPADDFHASSFDIPDEAGEDDNQDAKNVGRHSQRAVMTSFKPNSGSGAYLEAQQYITAHCQLYGCHCSINKQRKPTEKQKPNATTWSREIWCGWHHTYHCKKRYWIVVTNGRVHIEHKGQHNSHNGRTTGVKPTRHRGVLPHIVKIIALHVSWGLTGAAAILKALEQLVESGVNIGHLPSRQQITSIVQRWRLAMLAEGHRNTYAGLHFMSEKMNLLEMRKCKGYNKHSAGVYTVSDHVLKHIQKSILTGIQLNPYPQVSKSID